MDEDEWVVQAFIGNRSMDEVAKAIEMVADALMEESWGDSVVVSADRIMDDDEMENAIMATGAMWAHVHTQPGVVSCVPVLVDGVATNQLMVKVEFLKMPYRITVEMIPGSRGAEESIGDSVVPKEPIGGSALPARHQGPTR